MRIVHTSPSFPGAQINLKGMLLPLPRNAHGRPTVNDILKVRGQQLRLAPLCPGMAAAITRQRCGLPALILHAVWPAAWPTCLPAPALCCPPAGVRGHPAQGG